MTGLIQLAFHKIMQTRAYTVIILNGQEKSFAIYTDPSIGRTLQQLLTDATTPRPQTHALVHSIFEGMNTTIRQVVINHVEDTVYYCRLFIEQQLDDLKHIIEIDSRPSDALIWALMANAPVYCTAEVLEKTIAIED